MTKTLSDVIDMVMREERREELDMICRHLDTIGRSVSVASTEATRCSIQSIIIRLRALEGQL